MIKTIINKYRAIKRAAFLNQPAQATYQYAIIGAGEHATTQLYPCIWHIGIPIRMICTLTRSNAEKAARRFVNCTGTDNIDDILNDPDIKGVFVLTPPSTHIKLVQQLLAAGKSVYVEKPLGYAEHELLSILPDTLKSTLRVGFQRRYAPIAELTKKLINRPISYQYRYHIGAYPEGNALYEIFIHQLDYCLYIFGPAKLNHVSTTKNSSGKTFYIQLDHNEVVGNIELSTQYSWNNPEEKMEINQENSSILSHYPSILEMSKKPPQIFGVPLEKVMEQSIDTRVYLKANNSIPSLQNSSANMLGFYPAIYSFYQAVENDLKSEKEIHQIRELYRLLDELQQA